ncbi:MULTISPECIES: S9 family peptidase [unclassified Okeania]|uniref:S9 family peptidase n=1 Tax=unclassified Okeania TaxID=2634635 RepID=UPI0013BE6EB8|nr:MULTISPECIES: S9 family peptidase [unclassified Okeania]NES77624.1 S9 family peptidase [Okeania sp. SIO1H4]NET13688.1 S9 family peptidase [Okeania sp. SIO1H6]NET21252.1 S9 family peptidase [Okeania sp. SIO1H5]NET92671.1 S9 family peptidase [Okeania sp. SIO1H2]
MTTTTAEKITTKLPPLIPREILFGNPERTSPKLSPDGKYLAYIAPNEKNVLQIWVRTIGQEDDRQLTADKKRGIRMYFWTYNEDQLIYLQDADGDENYHLYQVNIQSNMVRDLTPFQGVKAEVIDLDHNFPDQILVGLNLKNPQTFDVYRINLNNGAVEFDTHNPGNIVGWTADAKFQILAAATITEDGGSDLLYRETTEKSWETIRHWGPDEDGGPSFFSNDGKTLYISANHDANAIRLLALDLATREEKVIAEDSQYDISGSLTHPITRAIEAVGFYKDKLEWQILDDSIAADFEFLKQAHKGEFRIVSRTLEDNNWLVAYFTDDGPVYYHTYDRTAKTITFLFSNQPQLEGLQLAPMEPISYAARDGLTIHGYLTKPVGVPTPAPAVLLVHGGPWARDTWGYRSQTQWLANRGYVVLQINFRGSTGYGKDFLNAGNREWGAKMHDDLIDGVNWLVEKGIADKDKIAIMGGSYGGYATLVGLTFTPEVFAAGVDIVGPSNLITLMQTIPPYWEPLKKVFFHRVGNLETEAEFLQSRSPLFFVDKIEKPLLIGQGANDPRVKESESTQIVKAMEDAGKPIEYVLYKDEGHGFARPENRLHFYAIAEEFLAKYLGGIFEPVGNIEGHSGLVH